MDKKIERLLKDDGENYIFPFFWQHGEEESVLREYMRVIHDSNIGAVCIESRPHPDFCGKQWWHDMDIILDEARKRGMKVWILDDSHFPTGYANGAMAGQPDELCRQSVCCRIYDLKGKVAVRIEKEELLHPDPFQKTMIENYIMKEQRKFDDDRILSVYAVRQDEEKNGFMDESSRIDLTPYIRNDELEWTIPEGNWKIYLLHLSRNFGYHRDYINMMDKASCRVLLDAVYEPHYEHYKDDFGTTIAGFFSDEPELGNGHLYEFNDPFGTPNDYPWSRELEQRLKEKMGADFGFLLSLLWEKDADPNLTAKVRYTYMDTVTKLVKEDFSVQIGSWCREHGVQYIGHLIEDNNHHTRTGSSLGHYFRGLAGQDMAGIDDIGGQVFPQGEDVSYDNGVFQSRNGEFYHYMLGKLGSSAAALEPLKKGNSMCEIFGNYGWSEGVRLEKYLVDHFMVRGINHFVPHAFSPKEFPDPDCPPHFYAQGNNPQYRHFGCLMAYMNRVCELISGGKHVSTAAVIYHGEGDWTGKHMTSDKIGHLLSDSQIDYDYIPQDVFAERDYFRTSIRDGILQVNTQEYKAVVVPYMEYITEKFARAVIEMGETGISVWFTDDFPKGICDNYSGTMDCSGTEESDETRILKVLKESCRSVKKEKIVGALWQKGIHEIRINPENDRIRYLHYVQKNGMNIWMFVNEGTEVYHGEIQKQTLEAENGGHTIYEYDAWENSLRPTKIIGENIKLTVEPLKSRIIISDPEMTEAEYKCTVTERIYEAEEKSTVELSENWRRSICRSIEYPEFRQEKEVVIPDNLAAEEPNFSGFVRYETSFYAKEYEKIYLEITDASEGVEVFLNEGSLGIQIVSPYRFELSEKVREGKNQLRIEVATTLEREMSGKPDHMGQITVSTALSGITGYINLWRIIE